MGTEQKLDQGLGISVGDPRSRHPYEKFANRPNIRAVDRATIRLLPPSSRVIDIGTGNGAMIELLVEEGLLLPTGTVVGVDPDSSALEIARQKFVSMRERAEFLEGSAEELPFEDESFDSGIFCNALHLTNPVKALSESARVIKKGGVLALNSAYTKDRAYPEGASRPWGLLIAGSRRKAVEQGFTPGDPVNLLNYTEDEYVEIARNAGFSKVEASHYVVEMDQGDMEAICDYWGFIEGALPNVDIDAGAASAVETAKELYTRLSASGKKTIPRGWTLIRAVK